MVNTILVLDGVEARSSDLVESLRELFPSARLVETADLAGFEAALGRETPDLAAIRLTLAGANEFEAAERCREKSSAMRVVLSAAAAPESLRRRAAELGCAMITVPATAEKVLAALDCCAAERAQTERAVTAQAYS